MREKPLGHHFVVMECEKSKRSAYIVVQHATQFSENSRWVPKLGKMGVPELIYKQVFQNWQKQGFRKPIWKFCKFVQRSTNQHPITNHTLTTTPNTLTTTKHNFQRPTELPLHNDAL